MRAVADAKSIRQLINGARKVHIDESLHEYIVTVVASTRTAPELSLGASPRAALALLRVSRVAAAAAGRAFVTPDDVKALTVPVLYAAGDGDENFAAQARSLYDATPTTVDRTLVVVHSSEHGVDFVNDHGDTSRQVRQAMLDFLVAHG